MTPTENPFDTPEQASAAISDAAAEMVQPALRKHPDHRGVALFMSIMEDRSLSVELKLEDGGDNVDPRDPAHVLAFYIQHNAPELLGKAALWLMATAAAEKKRRAGGGGTPPAAEIVEVLPIKPEAKAQDDTSRIIGAEQREIHNPAPIIVDSAGNAALPH